MSGEATSPHSLLRVTLGGPLPQDALEVREISLRGMEVCLTYPLASGQQLDVELEHPILEQGLSLQATAHWCRIEPGTQHPWAGLEFLQTNAEQRRDVRRIQAASMSCRVILGDAVVGFLLNQKPQMWAIYDENTVKRAMLVQTEDAFQARYLGHEPSQSIHTLEVDSLPEAVALVLALEGPPLIVPPEGGRWVPIRARPEPEPVATFNSPTAVEKATSRIPRPQAAPPAAEPAPPVEPARALESSDLSGSSDVITAGAFHRVLAGDQLAGYLAVTSVDDAWSIYDAEWNEVAILAPHGDKFRVTLVGEAAEDSLDYMVTKSFRGGVGLAFNLSVEPELDPPLNEPAGDESDDALAVVEQAAPPTPRGSSTSEAVVRAAGSVQTFERDVLDPVLAQHQVLDRERGAVGYVRKTPGVEGVYSVYDLEGDKLAIVAPEEGLYKILYMGASPGDSLEYLVARSFVGALAITFELLEPPTVDPPL